MTDSRFQNVIVAEFPRATSNLNSYLQRPRMPAFILVGNQKQPVGLLDYLRDLNLTITGFTPPTVVDHATKDCELLRIKLMRQGWPIYPVANQLLVQSETKCLFMASRSKSTVVYQIDHNTEDAQVHWIHQNVLHRLAAGEHVTGDTCVVLQEVPAKDWMVGLRDKGEQVVFPNLLSVAVSRFPLQDD